MYEEDDYFFENQPEFMAERGALDRAGNVDVGLGIGGVINLKKSGYTQMEKFKLIALATINIVNDLEMPHYKLSISQIKVMLEAADRLPDAEYKNPSAYAMAYVVAVHSDYRTLKIDQRSLDAAIEAYNEIREKIFTKIENADIVRYVRLCLLNNIK
jgi:hypothetical protein